MNAISTKRVPTSFPFLKPPLGLLQKCDKPKGSIIGFCFCGPPLGGVFLDFVWVPLGLSQNVISKGFFVLFFFQVLSLQAPSWLIT